MVRSRSVLALAGWWWLAAVLLWLAAFACERRTTFELYSSGGHLTWTVAGSTVGAPVAVARLDAVELHLMDSIEPPSGGILELNTDAGAVFRDRLPWRFALPAGTVAPVGDWQLDELAGSATVWRRPVTLDGSFTLSGALRGRFLHAATITLVGEPTVHLQLRRGLINSDLFILDADGTTLSASSIDPQPAADLAAAVSTWLRGAALACLVLALFALGGRTLDAVAPAAARWRPPSLSRAWQWTAAVALALLSTAASIWVAWGPLEALPHQPDEVACLVQAEWLSAGRLWMPATPIADHLDVPFVHHVDGRRVGHYPVGWPALLALGTLVGAPWLVAPVLRALFTVLLFLLGRELASPGVGLAAALLATVSPLATLLFASGLSHGAAATSLVAFLLLLLVAIRRSSAAAAAAAGLCAGAAFAMRPLPAVTVAAVGGLLLLAEAGHRDHRRAIRLAAAVIAGGLVATLPTLAANHALTGNPLAFPYTLATGTMYAASKLPFGLRNLDAILASTPPALFGWGWPAIGGRLALALPLAFAVLPLLRRRPERSDLLLVGWYAAVAAAFLGAQAGGLHGYGPRYHFEAFPALYLLAARGFARLAEGEADDGSAARPAAAVAALFLLLNLSALASLPQRLEMYRGYNQVDGCLRQQLAARDLDRALVLFADRDWRNWAEAAPFLSPELDGDLIFATAGDDPGEVIAMYGDRPVLVWDGERLYDLEP